jgi:penicillin-binding protein 1A
MRGRRRWLWAGAAALLVVLATLWLKPMAEHAVRARIQATALRHGIVAHVGGVHVGIWPLLRLEGVDLDLGHGLRLRADTVAATWPLQLRLALGDTTLAGPAGLEFGARPTTWKVTGLYDDQLRLALLAPQAGLSLRKQPAASGSDWIIEAHGLELANLLAVHRDALPLLDGGVADGRVELHTGPDAARYRVDLDLRGARLVALADGAGEDVQPGDPTDVALRFTGSWDRRAEAIDIPGFTATLGGAALSGSLTLRELATDPAIDLAIGVKQLDFAQLLGTSGLAVPGSLGLAPGARHDLGMASIDLRIRGRLAVPASLAVTQKIDFKPPRELPPAIARLGGDFDFTALSGTGQDRFIAISPAAPDFIALRDVPPLFVRTLLLAEDAGFYGHHGIDLRELPAAVLANWSRGAAARGASTITQQLAKNLFLSRDKQFGRKLQELAITFLIESALDKDRILEIYLNIIEWGPGLRGLRPAARRYFNCEPHALTPAQMAFLVSIIPGPILYQRSIAGGTPSPALRTLIDNLLAKLRSIDAIGEAEYARALADPLVIAGERRSD